LIGTLDVHVLAALFFLAVLAGAVFGLWHIARENMADILTALSVDDGLSACEARPVAAAA
jgi:hypothetical protein